MIVDDWGAGFPLTAAIAMAQPVRSETGLQKCLGVDVGLAE